MKKIKYVCKVCGKPYESYKETSYCCSIPCRRKYNNFDVICGTCGKPFSVYRSRYEKVMSGEVSGFYCSKACFDMAQTTRVKKICEYCGKEYDIVNCFKDIQKYCSRECYEKSRKEKSADYSITRFLRSNTQGWCNRKIAEVGKCIISGRKDGLSLHHIRGFNLLVKETLKILNIPCQTKIDELDDSEKKTLLNTFLIVQDKYPVAVINVDIHNMFHDEYGRGDNTEQQWDEFVNKHRNDFKIA